jgi:hypothetical protein
MQLVVAGLLRTAIIFVAATLSSASLIALAQYVMVLSSCASSLIVELVLSLFGLPFVGDNFLVLILILRFTLPLY